MLSLKVINTDLGQRYGSDFAPSACLAQSWPLLSMCLDGTPCLAVLALLEASGNCPFQEEVAYLASVASKGTFLSLSPAALTQVGSTQIPVLALMTLNDDIILSFLISSSMVAGKPPWLHWVKAGGFMKNQPHI